MQANTVPPFTAVMALTEPQLGVASGAVDSPLATRLDVRSSSAVHDIYQYLAAHQQSEDWRLRELLTYLDHWRAILCTEFKLEIPEAALSVDRLRCHRLGQFRFGHNGLGLRGEIVLNSKHYDRPGDWEMLGILLHELLHGWQQAHGRPGKRNYHNTQFRAKAREFGLIVDSGGCQWYEPDGPFIRLLRSHGVEVSDVVPAPGESARLARVGSSKLKKWSCGCTNVRVAVEDFRARCLKPECGHVFRLCTLADGAGIRVARTSL